jgi:hypothetical protein
MACNLGLTYKYEYTGASIECASPGHNNHFTKLDIGNIRPQIKITKEVVHHLELAGDRRHQYTHEETSRKKLKLNLLGLCSLQRTVARKESRITWLREGDACTRFFLANANGRQ